MDLYWLLSFQLMVVCIMAQSFDSSTVEQSHYGTAFYLSFIRHTASNKTLHITSETEGIVQVYVPSQSNPFEEQLLSSGYTQFNLSSKGLSNYPASGGKTGVYIITSVPVAVIASDVEYGQSSDAFLALPVTLAGTSYIVASYRGYVSLPSYKYSGMEIVAIYSNTTITINYPENITDNFTLDESEKHFRYMYEDLTGTMITANKPVSVTSGTFYAVIPNLGLATMIVEQMFPRQTWTNLYIVPPMPPMTLYIVRILSMEDQKVCFTNKTSSKCIQTNSSLNENHFFETEPVLVSSEAPVTVAQYGCPHFSSPHSSSGGFMVLVPGKENYLNRYKFAIPEIRHETKHFIAVIIPSSKVDGLVLDNESVSFDHEFSVVTSLGNYNVFIKETQVGYHEVSHNDSMVRFGALAYGIGPRHSYGMPLGLTFFSKGESSKAWSEWSECSVTCGTTGIQTRTRPCKNTQLGTVDVNCYTDSRLCNMGTCPVDGGFGVWGTWSSCTLTCGEGTQFRARACNNPIPQHGGRKCTGPDSETKPCLLRECSVDGGFSEWSIWSTCTATCGDGIKTRARSCDDPAPKHGGKDCTGTNKESTICQIQECPVNGNYSSWSSWSTCTLTCGSGFQARARVCNNPTPVHGGMDCIGQDTEMQSCNNEICPVIPYGHGCKLGSDKCEGESTECSGGKCRCTGDHYHDGDKCISKTSIYPTTDRVTIIVGSVAGVIIIILTVFAIFIAVLYRRKANKELTRNERPPNPVYYNTDTSELKVISTAVVKENVSSEGSTNESQYTSLDSDLKDTGSPYDDIKFN